MSKDSTTIIDELRDRGAPVHVIGDTDRAEVAVPADLPEPLAAIVAVVRLQQIALGLSEIRSIDADRPRSLSKVTMT
jgi:fructoselysine-6-P-deglycase FrlB-like protein